MAVRGPQVRIGPGAEVLFTSYIREETDRTERLKAEGEGAVARLSVSRSLRASQVIKSDQKDSRGGNV